MSSQVLPGPSRAVHERFSLTDRVVLITGASSGLGAAFASAVADAGADVVLMARRAERLEGTAQSVRALGRRALVVAGDVTVVGDCRRTVEQAVAEFGRVDGLVNTAGIEDRTPASRETDEEFGAVLDVNLAACFRMARETLPAMPRGGSIVNVSSVLAHSTLPFPTGAAYLASKAGVLGLTRSLARQWAVRQGIRVNSLLPGFFPSEMTDGAPLHLLEDRFVAGRLGEVSELGAALVFLLSDASSYMTGTELVVDGGFLLT